MEVNKLHLNYAETIAYNWLKEKGYKEIKHVSNITPDFICENGDKYEVKRLYKRKTKTNQLIIYEQQIKNLDSETVIIVVDTEMNEVVETFKWDIKNPLVHIVKDYIYNPEKYPKGNIYEIKDCGNSLHITLSKRFFKKGQKVKIITEEEDGLTEKKVREIFQEEFDKARTY